jgi:hypothetical protein
MGPFLLPRRYEGSAGKPAANRSESRRGPGVDHAGGSPSRQPAPAPGVAWSAADASVPGEGQEAPGRRTAPGAFHRDAARCGGAHATDKRAQIGSAIRQIESSPARALPADQTGFQEFHELSTVHKCLSGSAACGREVRLQSLARHEVVPQTLAESMILRHCDTDDVVFLHAPTASQGRHGADLQAHVTTENQRGENDDQ